MTYEEYIKGVEKEKPKKVTYEEYVSGLEKSSPKVEYNKPKVLMPSGVSPFGTMPMPMVIPPKEKSATEKWEEIKNIKDPVERMKAVQGTETLEAPPIDPVVDIPLAIGTGGTAQGLKQGLKQGSKALIKDVLSGASGGLTDVAGLGVKGAAKGAKELIKELPVEEIKKGVFEGIKKSKFAEPIKRRIYKDWDIVEKFYRKTPGYVPSKELSPFDIKQLYYKKVNNQLGEVKDWATDIDKSIVKTAKELKTDEPQLTKDVMNYLHAKHAPDYNKAIGENAAGITTEQANAIKSRIEELPHAEKIKEVAQKIKTFHDGTLDILEEGGVIDSTFKKSLKEKYPNHVGLQRIMDEDDIVSGLTGSGFDVKSTGIFKGEGSERPVKDILTNVYNNRLQAIKRAEKNIVDNSTFDMVKEFDSQLEQDLFSWKVLPKGENATPRDLVFYDKGKKTAITINNPIMAEALRGVGQEKIPGLIKAMGAITRFRGKTATKTLTFPIRNKIRDTLETVPWLLAQKETKTSKVLKAAVDPFGIKAVRDFNAGIDSIESATYKSLRKYGGAGGSYSAALKKTPDADMKAIRKLNRSNPRQAIDYLSKKLDNYSLIFEDSTRVNSYKALIDSGVPEQKAAIMAKRASVDFDQKGTWTPVMNSMYLFSGASMSGVGRFGGMVKGGKAVTKLAAEIAIPVFVVNEWNDRQDPEWTRVVSDYDRKNGLNVILPKEYPEEPTQYITIPVPYAFKPVNHMAQKMSDLASDRKINIKDTVSDLASITFESYSPINSGTGIQNIMPTPLSIPTDVALNRKFSGYPMYPKYMEGDKFPDSIKYFGTEKKSLVGEGLVKGTEWLAYNTKDEESKSQGFEFSPAVIHYAVQQALGGWAKDIEKGVDTARTISKGEVPELSDLPLVSSYLRKPDPELYKDTEEEKIQKYGEQEYNRRRFYQREDIKEFTSTPETINYILKQPIQDQKSLISSLKSGMMDKMTQKQEWLRWYDKLANLPPEVREEVFFYRYDKSPKNIQEKMKTDAVINGVLTEDVFLVHYTKKKKS
jgi:hypothetical protein